MTSNVDVNYVSCSSDVLVVYFPALLDTWSDHTDKQLSLFSGYSWLQQPPLLFGGPSQAGFSSFGPIPCCRSPWLTLGQMQWYGWHPLSTCNGNSPQIHVCFKSHVAVYIHTCNVYVHIIYVYITYIYTNIIYMYMQ